MALLLIETTTPDDVTDAVGAGTLWGVSLGTTTKASSYSDYVLIKCTKTRAFNLSNAAPDDVMTPFQDDEPPSFTEATSQEKAWWLRGKL